MILIKMENFKESRIDPDVSDKRLLETGNFNLAGEGFSSAADIFSLKPNKTEQASSILENKVQNFFNEHSVNASIPTTYTTLAVTLQRDIEKIVLVQCRSIP